LYENYFSFAHYLVGCTTKPGQSLLENKAVVLRSEKEVWSNGNLAVADELYSPDFVLPLHSGPDWRGLEGIKGEVRQHRISLPDWNERVDDIVAERDRVVIRFTSTGTQRGEFGGIAPTGRKVKMKSRFIGWPVAR
jgi:ketosteroid isomerase-like protein